MAPSQQPRIPTVKEKTRKVRKFPSRPEPATTVRPVPGATELQLVRQQRPKPKARDEELISVCVEFALCLVSIVRTMFPGRPDQTSACL